MFEFSLRYSDCLACNFEVSTTDHDYAQSTCCMLSVTDCMSIVMFQTMDSVYATFTLMILSALLHLSLTKC